MRVILISMKHGLQIGKSVNSSVIFTIYEIITISFEVVSNKMTMIVILLVPIEYRFHWLPFYQLSTFDYLVLPLENQSKWH